MLLNLGCLFLVVVVSGSLAVDTPSSLDVLPPESPSTTLDKEFIGASRSVNINPITNYLLQSLAQESDPKRRYQRYRDLQDLQMLRYAVLNKELM